MLLTKEQVRTSKDRKIIKVRTPEWAPESGLSAAEIRDCHVFVRSMDGKERDSFENWWLENKKAQGGLFRANFCARCICDESGKLMFDATDVSWLATKSSKCLSRIYSAGAALSGISAEDEKELEKNSEAEDGFPSS